MFVNSLTRKMPCHDCKFDGDCTIQDVFSDIWSGLTSSVEDLTFRCLAKEVLGNVPNEQAQPEVK